MRLALIALVLWSVHGVASAQAQAKPTARADRYYATAYTTPGNVDIILINWTGKERVLCLVPIPAVHEFLQLGKKPKIADRKGCEPVQGGSATLDIHFPKNEWTNKVLPIGIALVEQVPTEVQQPDIMHFFIDTTGAIRPASRAEIEKAYPRGKRI